MQKRSTAGSGLHTNEKGNGRQPNDGKCNRCSLDGCSWKEEVVEVALYSSFPKNKEFY